MSKKIKHAIITGSIVLGLSAAAGGTWFFLSRGGNSDSQTMISSEESVFTDTEAPGTTETLAKNNTTPASSIQEVAKTIYASEVKLHGSANLETPVAAQSFDEQISSDNGAAKEETPDSPKSISKEKKEPIVLTDATERDTSGKDTAPAEPVTEPPKKDPSEKTSPNSEKEKPSDNPVSDPSGTEKKTVVEKPGKTIEEQPAADASSTKTSAEKQSTEKQSSDKASDDKSSTEKTGSGTGSSDKAPGTKSSTDQPSTEKPVCTHKWVWKTHTETKVIPEVSHEVPVYDDGWDEAVTVRKIYCSECEQLYEDNEDYYAHDKCHGSFGHMTVIDHYIHHEPEVLYYDTIVDEPEHKETVTVNDYEYCSICGTRK
ncbi:MAG: hypothetical protein IJM27_12600 [Eubacterium sp.]|nr:hypothetical protein [Eubacterium sp.]